jgi:hypothetical protein
MRHLIVTQLSVLLAECEPDALIVVPSSDHSYRDATAQKATAMFHRESNYLYEDYGDMNADESKDDARLSVVVIE